MNEKVAADDSAPISRDWPKFTARLAGVLSVMCEDQFLVIHEKNSNRFVQFAAQGNYGMRAEISSNAYLSQSERLTDRQAAQLVGTGWRAPTGDPRQSTPERDPDGSPNYFIDFPAPIKPSRIAGKAVAALSKVLRVPHPGFLEYKAYDTHSNDLVFSQLGIKRFEKSDQYDLGKIARRLLSAIKEITDIKDLDYDKDGDIGICFRNVAVFMRVIGNPPAIRFYSPLVQNVPETDQLYARLNELNSGIGSLHFFVRDETIYAISEIAASPLHYAVLANAMRDFCTIVDGVDELLKAEFGGKVINFRHMKSAEPEMKIIWQEWSVVPDFHHFGHGIHFHDKWKERDASLVAFVEGYEWLHGNPPEVVINCIKPDAITTPNVLKAMKAKVEELLRSKRVPSGMITRRIEAVPNG